jgi:hypothetical protein
MAHLETKASFYQTPRRDVAMSEVVYRCKTKATDREGDQFRLSFNWMLAKFYELRLTRREIQCGDWTIPYAEIDDAVLMAIAPPYILGYVLRVKSRGKTYQFRLLSTSPWWGWGLWDLDRFWLGDIALPLRRELVNLDWRGSRNCMLFAWTVPTGVFLIEILALFIFG